MAGKGDDEDRGVDCVQKPAPGSGLDLFETRQRLEKEGEISGRRVHPFEHVTLGRISFVAHHAKVPIKEFDLVGEYVEC